MKTDIKYEGEMSPHERAEYWLEQTSSTLTKEFVQYGSMPWDDSETNRNIWKITLSTESDDGQINSLSFDYGDSIVNSCRKVIKKYADVANKTDRPEVLISHAVKGVGLMSGEKHIIFTHFIPENDVHSPSIQTVMGLALYYDRPHKAGKEVRKYVDMIMDKVSGRALRGAVDYLNKAVTKSCPHSIAEAKKVIDMVANLTNVKDLRYTSVTLSKSLTGVVWLSLGRWAKRMLNNSVEVWEQSTEGREPPSDDLLTCLDPWAVDTSIDDECVQFLEFCSMFGYDDDSRRAHQTFKECKRQSQQLQNMYSENQLDALQEIDC